MLMKLKWESGLIQLVLTNAFAILRRITNVSSLFLNQGLFFKIRISQLNGFYFDWKYD